MIQLFKFLILAQLKSHTDAETSVHIWKYSCEIGDDIWLLN